VTAAPKTANVSSTPELVIPLVILNQRFWYDLFPNVTVIGDILLCEPLK